MGRDNLAQEILESATPERVKSIASRVPPTPPPHHNSTWHREKVGFMKEILVAKTKSCPEFRQSLLESIDMHLVEAVTIEIFWSCGLNPGDAASTRPPYYPGQNQLGRLLEHT